MNKKLFQAAILSFIITIITFCLHMFNNVDSMLNDHSFKISNSYLAIAYDLHKTYYPFAKRPLTNLLIELLSYTFHSSIGFSFIIVNFTFIFFNGILVYKLSSIFSQNHKNNLINMVIFFLCFSNIFAFFVPIYSYDEPLQYFFILLSLIYFFKKKWLYFILLFSISIMARESSIILLPGLWLLSLNEQKLINLENLKKTLYLGIPVLVYIVFIIIYINKNNLIDSNEEDIKNRLIHFKLNIGENIAAAETFFSLFLILGLPIYFLYISIIKKSYSSLLEKKLLKSFFITLIINSVIVILTTKARESRLFILPLFFLWPIFFNIIKEEICEVFKFSNYINLFKRWDYFILFGFLIFLNNLICYKMYTITDGDASQNYFNLYLFLTITIIIFHSLFTILNREKELLK